MSWMGVIPCRAAAIPTPNPIRRRIFLAGSWNCIVGIFPRLPKLEGKTREYIYGLHRVPGEASREIPPAGIARRASPRPRPGRGSSVRDVMRPLTGAVSARPLDVTGIACAPSAESLKVFVSK